MKATQITVKTTINAPVDKVWEFWTSPEHIVQWNFASDDWHCPSAENDIRTGGKFKSTMASKDGKMSFEFEGVYDEVVQFQSIRYSLEDARQIFISFEEISEGTVITETFDAEGENPVEMQQAGWQAILDNFKKHVESN